MVAAEQGEYTRAANGTAELAFISSLDESQPWSKPEKMVAGFNGVMFGGSGEYDFDGGRPLDDPARKTSKEIVERVRPLVEFLLRNDVPLLGVCYGHQIVSEVKGVPVVNDLSQKKVGSFPVQLTQEGKQDVLFGDMPEVFVGQYGHKDSLSGLPEGAVLLAKSDVCRTSALRFGTSAYTMQFHPELTADDVKWKLQNSPGYLPEGVDISSIIKPSVEASTIIPHFIERVAR
jgi:GMP synthase (glutamine-hydrolysing)